MQTRGGVYWTLLTGTVQTRGGVYWAHLLGQCRLEVVCTGPANCEHADQRWCVLGLWLPVTTLAENNQRYDTETLLSTPELIW